MEVDIESDCLELVAAVQEAVEDFSEIDHLLCLHFFAKKLAKQPCLIKFTEYLVPRKRHCLLDLQVFNYNMASSFAIPPKEKYDVFISFRGADTRKTFTSHLHAALIRRKIDTYIDYRLEKGEELEGALLKAIEESKIYVIIFSENYASSTWCLKELAYIVECEGRNGHYVIPVFYGIDPSVVRHQMESYQIAFYKHEQMLEVLKWKGALKKVANISGFDSTSRTVRDDHDLLEKVVRDVLTKLNCESTSNLTDHLVGVESRIQSIIMKLDIIPDDIRVRFVAIWGMGGIGKTTLADAVFHGLSSQFEACCFLKNVRERSGGKGNISPQLYHLRDVLLRQLLEDSNLTICTPTVDSYVKKRLNRKKVLIVLDDVNDSSQLKFLAGDQIPFGPGSRIIITTRDMQPVRQMQVTRKSVNHDVKIYKVEELNGDESLQLFHSSTPTDFTANSKVLKMVVHYAAGIPLALNILHSLFIQCKKRKEQELLWDKLKKFPNKKLHNVFRTSYEGLERNEKEIFLDITCFHRGRELCETKRILAACGLFPDDGIKILIDMSLISVKDDCICIHDVIQQMGVHVVDEECVAEPGNRSRLHYYKDVSHVLENNTGTATIQSIYGKCVTLSPHAFTKMHNLRFLKLENIEFDGEANLESLPNALVYLFWDYCPLKYLPSKFQPKNLVELHMSCSRLHRLWNEGRNPMNLKVIDLSYSSELVEVAFLSNCVNTESINLRGCTSLVEVPDLTRSVRIKSINLNGCRKLKKMPLTFFVCSLTSLNLSYCTELQKIPDCLNSLPALQSLYLTGTRIETIPPTIKQVYGLRSLLLYSCKQLQSLPVLPCLLERLDASDCINLKTVSVSVTELMEGLGKLRSGERIERHSFHGCYNLDASARSNIMNDAHQRIMRMATACNLGRLSSGNVVLECVGSEIPKWFNCQIDGSSMNIKLPLHWFDTKFFLVFAVRVASDMGGAYGSTQCEMILKTNNVEGRSINLGDTYVFKSSNTDKVLVWYNKFAVVPDEAKWATEASFDFYVQEFSGGRLNCVRRCGVSFLYANGQDDIRKFDVIHPIAKTSTLR